MFSKPFAPNPPHELSQHDSDSFPTGNQSGIIREGELLPRANRRSYPSSYRDSKVLNPITYSELKANPELIGAFVAQMDVKEQEIVGLHLVQWTIPM